MKKIVFLAVAGIFAMQAFYAHILEGKADRLVPSQAACIPAAVWNLTNFMQQAATRASTTYTGTGKAVDGSTACNQVRLGLAAIPHGQYSLTVFYTGQEAVAHALVNAMAGLVKAFSGESSNDNGQDLLAPLAARRLLLLFDRLVPLLSFGEDTPALPSSTAKVTETASMPSASAVFLTAPASLEERAIAMDLPLWILQTGFQKLCMPLGLSLPVAVNSPSAVTVNFTETAAWETTSPHASITSNVR